MGIASAWKQIITANATKVTLINRVEQILILAIYYPVKATVQKSYRWFIISSDRLPETVRETLTKDHVMIKMNVQEVNINVTIH